MKTFQSTKLENLIYKEYFNNFFKIIILYVKNQFCKVYVYEKWKNDNEYEIFISKLQFPTCMNFCNYYKIN